MNVRPPNMGVYGTWFRVTKTEAKMEPSLKMTSHFISSCWPTTTEGEQLPSVEVDGSGSIKIPQTEAALKKVTKELGAPVKTVKIKLHPRSLEDHILLRKIVGTTRWTYNQCVHTVRDPNYRAERETTIDAKTGKLVFASIDVSRKVAVVNESYTQQDVQQLRTTSNGILVSENVEVSSLWSRNGS